MKKTISTFFLLIASIIIFPCCSSDDDNQKKFSGLAFAEENGECQYNRVSATHITTTLTKCTHEYGVWCVNKDRRTTQNIKI
jgi:ABC-type Fe3+-citrate transport system substrate-binding protein